MTAILRLLETSHVAETWVRFSFSYLLINDDDDDDDDGQLAGDNKQNSILKLATNQAVLAHALVLGMQAPGDGSLALLICL